MKELTLGEILTNAFTALVNSEVFILVILELAILLLAMSFSKVTHKKVIKVVATTASLVVAGFYAFNYIDTISTFLIINESNLYINKLTIHAANNPIAVSFKLINTGSV